MRISDWSSDVCSSDLPALRATRHRLLRRARQQARIELAEGHADVLALAVAQDAERALRAPRHRADDRWQVAGLADLRAVDRTDHLADPQPRLVAGAAGASVVGQVAAPLRQTSGLGRPRTPFLKPHPT